MSVTTARLTQSSDSRMMATLAWPEWLHLNRPSHHRRCPVDRHQIVLARLRARADIAEIVGIIADLEKRLVDGGSPSFREL